MKKFLIFIAAIMMVASVSFGVACTSSLPPTTGNGDDKYTDYGVAPIITVDFDGYTESSLPNAVINKQYKLFTATAHDIYERAVDVDTSVYLYYYSEGRALVDVQDGCFTPENYGTYTLEFSAVDAFGNTSEVCVDVECNEKQELSANLSTGATNGVVGQSITLADLQVQNSAGNVEVSVMVALKDSNIVYDVTDTRKFVPEYTGEYQVTYEYADYNESGSTSYDIVVSESDAPVMADFAVPKQFILGAEYTLPTPSKCYYSTQSKKYDIVPQIFVRYGGDPDLVELDGTFTPEEEGALEIVYRATYGNKVSEKTFNSTVIDTGLLGEFNMANYFYGEYTTAVTTRDDVVITTAKDGAGFDFVNALPSGKVSFTLGIDESNNKFDRLDMYLTDSLNPNLSLKFSFVKNGETGRFIVNDDDNTNISYGFNKLMRTEFLYDDRSREVTFGGSTTIEVSTTVYGERFTGFESDTVNLSMVFGGVYGSASVHIFQINNQSFYDEMGDGVAPYVIFEKYQGGKVYVGDEVEIERIYVGDVLDPSITVKYYVKAPNGSYALDLDGNELDQDTAYNVNHKFTVTQVGSYNISIVFSDSAGNEDIYSYGIKVTAKDLVSVYLPEQGATSIKFGNAITLKKAVVNAIDDTGYTINVYVLCPDNIVDYVENGNGGVYSPDLYGEYKVFYYVYDDLGEVSVVSYTFVVE